MLAFYKNSTTVRNTLVLAFSGCSQERNQQLLQPEGTWRDWLISTQRHREKKRKNGFKFPFSQDVNLLIRSICNSLVVSKMTINYSLKGTSLCLDGLLCVCTVGQAMNCDLDWLEEVQVGIGRSAALIPWKIVRDASVRRGAEIICTSNVSNTSKWI